MASQSFAELKMIDDDQLSDVTGKKGITLDLAFGIDIGEFMYEDGGSIVMQGLTIGGMDRTGSFINGFGVREGGDVGTTYDEGVNYNEAVPDPTGDLLTDNAGGSNMLNNVRVEIDVAGDGSTNGQLLFVFGGVPFYAADNEFMWAWGDFAGTNPCGSAPLGGTAGCEFTAGDGDLVIHAKPIDKSATDNGTSQTIADFGIEMDAFKIKDSSYNAGDDVRVALGAGQNDSEAFIDSGSVSTTIIENFKMEGYFGGFDMLIENNGNGFGTYDGRFGSQGNFTETGRGYAASKIKVNSNFKVTEMEYDFKIAGIRYEGMQIHNHRGDHQMFDYLTQEDYGGAGGAESQGYAQTNTQIFAVNEAVLKPHLLAVSEDPYHDGVAMFNRFQGDMDIEHMSFGDERVSIGSQYWTDMNVYTNRIITGH